MKTKRLWVGFLAASLGALVALSFLPDVFGGWDQRATLDRTGALGLARDKAAHLKLGPMANSRKGQEALRYTNDDTAQAFIELQGGGLDRLNQAARAGTYSPSRWTVRHFRESDVFEASFFFSPSGTFLGWTERHAENESLPSLTEREARDQVMTRARESGVVDLTKWTLIETSSVNQPGGRLDWTFAWKRDPSPFGQGELRWTAGVTGNLVTRLEPSLRVPDSFLRWYENERSTNSLIATLSLVGMALLGLAAGAGALRLGRHKQVAWRKSWVAGAVLGMGASMAQVNALGQAGMTYDTALPMGVFWATQGFVLLLVWGLSSLFFGFTIAGADALYRRSFPQAFSLGTRGAWNRVAGRDLGVKITGGLLGVPLWLLAVTVFYAFTKGVLGWWTPASGLADPNIVGQFVPWFTPLGNAFQAAVWEEIFFRALPLALAVWAGQKWGRPRLWVGTTLVFQALVFASGHAGYPGLPGWSRLVELTVPALIFGLVVLRWGLIPAIVLHFGYDFVLMSQPIFTTDSAALIPDRVAIVVVGLALPALAAWHWFFAKPSRPIEPQTEAPPELERSEVEPVLAEAPPITANLPAPRWHWPWLAVLAVTGLGALVWTWSLPVATLHVDRSTAQRLALQALADRGFVPDSHWTLDVTVADQPGEEDRYVRSVGGPRLAQSARDHGFLPRPRWVFQWSDYTGDVQTRERWSVTVADTDRPLRIHHQLPEAKPGVRLTREEALEKAEAAIAAQFGTLGAHLNSAVEAQLPHRSDWTLDFDPLATSSVRWGASIRVVVSGDEITDAYRFVFIPEDWTREWQKNQSMVGLLLFVSGFLLFALIGWTVVRGFRAWTTKTFHKPGFFAVAASVGGAMVLEWFNTLGTQTQSFRLVQPWTTQILPMVLLVPVVFVALGLLWGLAAGGLIRPGSRWTRPRFPSLVPGVVVGVAWVGFTGLILKIFPATTSVFTAASAAAATVPGLVAVFLAVAGMMVAIPALFLWDRANSLVGRRWGALGVFLVMAAGACLHNRLPVDTWDTALIQMGWAAVVALGAWIVLRRDLRQIIVVIAVDGIVSYVSTLVSSPYPGAWWAGVLGIITTLAWAFFFLGWDWGRAEEKTRGPDQSEGLTKTTSD